MRIPVETCERPYIVFKATTKRRQQQTATMNHTSPSHWGSNCLHHSMHAEGYRKTSEQQSALSSFFTEMFNETSTVEIQIDNARSRRRCRSSSPLNDQSFATSPKKDRASIRWELIASKDHNDVKITAPLRRRVSHEPLEKLMKDRFSQKATHEKCTALSIQKEMLSVPPQAMKNEIGDTSPCNSSVGSTTSDLLTEALDLLSTSSGDNNDVISAERSLV